MTIDQSVSVFAARIFASTARRRGLAIMLLALTVWAIVAGSSTGGQPSKPPSGFSDIDLYRLIVRGVRQGGNYYDVAVAAQATHGYPVLPASTIRTPVLIWLLAAVGTTAAYGLLLILVGAGCVGALVRFEVLAGSRLRWIGSLLVLALSLALIAAPSSVYFQESWALALMLLALVSRTARRWWPCVALGLLAALMRELAAPFLVAMLAMAIVEHRRREAAAWLGAIAVFVTAYAAHMWLAHRAVESWTGLAQHSQGWVRFGGWPLVVDMVRNTTPLMIAPYWLAAAIAALALYGWMTCANTLGLRFGATCAAFMIPFMVVGRDQNVYWGLLFAPLLLPGVAMAGRRTPAQSPPTKEPK